MLEAGFLGDRTRTSASFWIDPLTAAFYSLRAQKSRWVRLLLRLRTLLLQRLTATCRSAYSSFLFAVKSKGIRLQIALREISPHQYLVQRSSHPPSDRCITCSSSAPAAVSRKDLAVRKYAMSRISEKTASTRLSERRDLTGDQACVLTGCRRGIDAKYASKY